MRSSGTRTQRCGPAEAEKRLRHAKQFLAVGELAADDQREDGSLEYGNAAAALVRQVAGVGHAASKELRSLIALKDNAQYGFYSVGGHELRGALRRARRLVELAEAVLDR